jgi:hypothetical protein
MVSRGGAGSEDYFVRAQLSTTSSMERSCADWFLQLWLRGNRTE